MDITGYAQLSPDTVIDAIEATGRRSDARVLALNSYENRVYQVGIEDGLPVIAKFYRPGRWSDAQIREEHSFCLELAAAELPVVAPLRADDGDTLFFHEGYRYALFTRKGGGAPDVGDLDQLHRIGTLLGRIHAVAQAKPFAQRPTLDVATFLDAPAALLLDGSHIPADLREPFRVLFAQLRAHVAPALADGHRWIRTQGDCHPGNIVWTRDDGPWFVDFDDCRMAPAVQDLWMLLSGDTHEQRLQLAELLDGYETFADFDRRQLRLIEPLRTLRRVHHAGWIAARWQDPAFPRAFPWFAAPTYWQELLGSLREQLAVLTSDHGDALVTG